MKNREMKQDRFKKVETIVGTLFFAEQKAEPQGGDVLK
ncbi:hypothetical protein V6x_04620 [Gimesia chilikensis]|uniref:Uncharacterized protein n=1 Tax=Gimesia chilikensis TaxID=2605989 RepID=A0A517W6C1_9PLAN|nr:hypothetical protein V6x_04620 [Gimesia chilikensis]